MTVIEDTIKVTVLETRTIRLGTARHQNVDETVMYQIFQETNETIRWKDRDSDIVVPTAFLPTDMGTNTFFSSISEGYLTRLFAFMDFNGYWVYIPEVIHDATGWADQPGNHIAVDGGESLFNGALAHEYLHNLGRPHKCVEHNILWGSGCEATAHGDGDTVNSSQYNLLK